MIATELTRAERAYTHADRDVAHYQRILAGSLSDKQRYEARVQLSCAVRRRWMAKDAMEEE